METCAAAAAKIFSDYDAPLKQLAGDLKTEKGDSISWDAASNLPTALEGALKLCEIGWISCEGMELESFMHGKFRGAGQESPFFVLAQDDKSYRTAVNFVAVARKLNADLCDDYGQSDPAGKGFVL